MWAVGRRAVLAIAGVVALVVGGAAPAGAAPVISSPGCEAGVSQFYCYIEISGAQAPYTVRWTRDGIAIGSWDDLHFVRGTCSRGQYVSIIATVTDATGSATAQLGAGCGTPWE